MVSDVKMVDEKTEVTNQSQTMAFAATIKPIDLKATNLAMD